MTLYNAIVALPAGDAEKLIAYRHENGGRMPPDLPPTEWVANVWRNPAGYIAYDVQSTRLSDLDILLSEYPSTRVYGAWSRETGEIARDLRDDCIDLMPDVVDYDDSGNEARRSRPATCYDVHLWAGQAARDWGT